MSTIRSPGRRRQHVRELRPLNRDARRRRVAGVIASTTRGVAASALGTLAMDASLYRRYRHDGGTAQFPAWESSAGLTSWEDAPAPALVAERLLEALLGREISPRNARVLNNATHWAFGLATGAAYGLIFGSRRQRKLWDGIAFGTVVWTGGYVVLPALGVYKPIWRYSVATLGKDLSAHLVFGTATAAAFQLLGR